MLARVGWRSRAPTNGDRQVKALTRWKDCPVIGIFTAIGFGVERPVGVAPGNFVHAIQVNDQDPGILQIVVARILHKEHEDFHPITVVKAAEFDCKGY